MKISLALFAGASGGLVRREAAKGEIQFVDLELENVQKKECRASQTGGLVESVFVDERERLGVAECSKKDVCLLMRELDMDFYDRAVGGELDGAGDAVRVELEAGTCEKNTRGGHKTDGIKMEALSQGECEREAANENFRFKVEERTDTPSGCYHIDGSHFYYYNAFATQVKAGVAYIQTSKQHNIENLRKQVFEGSKYKDSKKVQTKILCKTVQRLSKDEAVYFSPYKIKERMLDADRAQHNTACSPGMMAELYRKSRTSSPCAEILSFETKAEYHQASDAIAAGDMEYAKKLMEKNVLFEVLTNKWCPQNWKEAKKCEVNFHTTRKGFQAKLAMTYDSCDSVEDETLSSITNNMDAAAPPDFYRDGAAQFSDYCVGWKAGPAAAGREVPEEGWCDWCDAASARVPRSDWFDDWCVSTAPSSAKINRAVGTAHHNSPSATGDMIPDPQLIDYDRFIDTEETKNGLDNINKQLQCGESVSPFKPKFDSLREEIGVTECSKKDVCLLMRELDMDFHARATGGDLAGAGVVTLIPIQAGTCDGNTLTAGALKDREAKGRGVNMEALTEEQCKKEAGNQGIKFRKKASDDAPTGCYSLEAQRKDEVMIYNPTTTSVKAGNHRVCIEFCDKAWAVMANMVHEIQCYSVTRLDEEEARYFSPYKLKENMKAERAAFNTACSPSLMAQLFRDKKTSSPCGEVLTFDDSKYRQASDAVAVDDEEYLAALMQKNVLFDVLASRWCPSVWNDSDTCPVSREGYEDKYSLDDNSCKGIDDETLASITDDMDKKDPNDFFIGLGAHETGVRHGRTGRAGRGHH